VRRSMVIFVTFLIIQHSFHFSSSECCSPKRFFLYRQAALFHNPPF